MYSKIYTIYCQLCVPYTNTCRMCYYYHATQPFDFLGQIYYISPLKGHLHYKLVFCQNVIHYCEWFMDIFISLKDCASYLRNFNFHIFWSSSKLKDYDTIMNITTCWVAYFLSFQNLANRQKTECRSFSTKFRTSCRTFLIFEELKYLRIRKSLEAGIHQIWKFLTLAFKKCKTLIICSNIF